jgi:hypothetical protein
MPEIDFQINEFRTYEAKVEGISLGFINLGTGGYSPSVGELIQYDGITVILKDGREFSDVPQLRTAIQSGWFVQVGDKVTKYRPKAAGIQVRATEQRGNERPSKMTIVTEVAEDTQVGSVSARKASREAANAEATRRVPLETQVAQVALKQHESSPTGDDELDEILFGIDEEMDEWVVTQQEPEVEDEVEDEEDPEIEIRARAEADILDMLASLDDEPAPKRGKKKVATRTARNLPIDAQDERVVMPIVKEDTTETSGTVVGNVAEQKRTVVERAQEISMGSVARATPEAKSPAPKPRIGGAGAIVVDEQRDMGRIQLSSTAGAPIRLDESAKVSSSSTEAVKMGEGAQVGGHQKKAFAVQQEGQEGVAVGRVLSPTHTTFEANERNTSSTSIQRAQEGKRLPIEKFETDEKVVGNVSDGAPARAVATGDVQEAKTGDELTDILPDAATSPTPEVHRRPEDDPAYMAVKMLIPDFEWNKDRQVKERVAAALKHIKNPQYIKGILAVETELAREEIKKALAVELEKRAKAKKAKKAKKEAK